MTSDDGVRRSRRQVETALADLRRAVPAPIAAGSAARSWLPVVLAASAGLALSLSLRRLGAKRRRRER